MARSIQVSPLTAKILACILTAIIFVADWVTGININVAVFYACVIVILAWTLSPKWIWGWAILAVVLTVIAAVTTGSSYVLADAVNRVITVCMLGITATFVHFSIIIAQQLDANKRLLTEIQERKRAEDSLRRAQEDLARISRITTMGELAASIAHEVNQPLSGIVINGNACLRWLAHIKTDSPSLLEARQATERIVRDGKRAGEVVSRLRNFFKKSSSERKPLDINDVIDEVVILVRNEVERKRVALRTDLAERLPRIVGDTVQLQQVLLNLILNGAEAMTLVEDRLRELTVRSGPVDGGGVKVEVQDSGIGVEPEKRDSIFSAFYTTKPGGMGMGLSISRSIVENHGGRLWIQANDGPGATFCFTVVNLG